MRHWRVHYSDGIAWANAAGLYNDAHDTCLSYQLSLGRAIKHGGEKAGHEGLNLRAGIAKPGDAHQRSLANPKDGAIGQAEYGQPGSGDVLAHLPRHDMQTLKGQLNEQLAVHEMNLP